MLSKARLTSQLLFLFIFITLMIIGKAQIWMALIFASVFLATFLGRFYCGWMCPMNTLMRPTKFFSKKLGFVKKDVPEIFKTRKPKYIAFSLFLIGLFFTIYTITQGKKFPLPLIIIPIALVATFFINETTWHTYLCPWGTLFGFTARLSKFRIKSDNCIGCSACSKSCPADTLIVDKDNGTVSDPKDCLLCFECVSKCPTKSLSYTSKK